MSTRGIDEQLWVTTRWVLVAFIFGVVAIALWAVRDMVLLLLAAAIISVLLTIPVRWLVGRGIPRPVAVVITLIATVIAVVVTFALILPQLLGQFGLLIELIPEAASALQQRIEEMNLPERYPFLQDVDLSRIGNTIVESIINGLNAITSQVFPFFNSLTSTVISVLVVLLASIYFLANPKMHERGLIKLVPIRYRPRAREIISSLDAALRGYLEAQIISMMLIGVGTWAGLMLLGVPLSAALGTLTGLFSFVPNFGPLAALIPILAVTVLNAPDKVIWVIVIFYGIQLIVSQFIGPMLVSQEINLPPILVLVSQVVAGVFFGFLGLLLSVPLAAVFMVLVREIYVKDILGDREDEKVPKTQPASARTGHMPAGVATAEPSGGDPHDPGTG